MNEQVDYEFTDRDIIKEYRLYGDVKRVCIENKIVRQILRREGVL